MRNTDWIIGVCIYTGHETKIMKNGAKPKPKVSKIAKATNTYIVITMLIQLVFSLVAGTITVLWTGFRGEDYWYIYPDPADAADTDYLI